MTKSTILNKIYLGCFFVILALPFLNLDPWFSPPDWGKTVIFRITLSVLLLIFLHQILSSKERLSARFSGKVKPGIYLLLALLAIFFLAAVFSLDASYSFWGTPYRSGGFVNFAFYIILAFLAFLTLKEQDWQKIWNFSLIIGTLVAILAIFQWLGTFADVLITYEIRPPSTLGNPILLAIYLLLLSFLALALAAKEKKLFKKIVLFSAFSLFLFVTFLTYSRAAYLGLAAGLSYFFFFYPYKKHRLSLVSRISFAAFLIFLSLGLYYINTQSELPEFIQENRDLRIMANRLSLERALQDSRISGWKVGWQALQDRPILGYGPENFAIGFDRHYDPSLPKIEERPGGADKWWDKAHNFLFDISVTAGIPALIIYLLLIGALFKQLQKIKRSDEKNSAIIQGIQAAFIAYLVANFFSFDSFSTYLIFFLIVGYSLFLINGCQPLLQKDAMLEKKDRKNLSKWKKHRKPILAFCLIVAVWFVWSFNIKPLQINKEINLALYETKTGYCDRALNRMENILPRKSILDGYLRIKYLEVINTCIQEKTIDESYPLAKKAGEIMEENVQIMPYFTRNWIWLGKYNNLLLENWQKTEAAEKAEKAFAKAGLLSPKRQEVFEGWIKTDLLTGQYEKAEEKAEECIMLNEKFAGCWWLKALTYVYLNDPEKAREYMETARLKGYRIKSVDALLELTKAYIEIGNYPGLLETYPEIIKLEPEEPQHYASLAFVYKELGQNEKARETALKIIELFPEHKTEAEEFLKQLP